MNTEFVKQTMRDNLGRTLIPHVADGLWSIYDNALKACQRNGQPEKTLQTFQNLLTRIPHWNEETLQKEVERIETASKCDYIEDLVLGVFVSYIRAFASLQQSEATHVEVRLSARLSPSSSRRFIPPPPASAGRPPTSSRPSALRPSSRRATVARLRPFLRLPCPRSSPASFPGATSARRISRRVRLPPSPSPRRVRTLLLPRLP